MLLSVIQTRKNNPKGRSCVRFHESCGAFLALTGSSQMGESER